MIKRELALDEALPVEARSTIHRGRTFRFRANVAFGLCMSVRSYDRGMAPHSLIVITTGNVGSKRAQIDGTGTGTGTGISFLDMCMSIEKSSPYIH